MMDDAHKLNDLFNAFRPDHGFGLGEAPAGVGPENKRSLRAGDEGVSGEDSA